MLFCVNWAMLVSIACNQETITNLDFVLSLSKVHYTPSINRLGCQWRILKLKGALEVLLSILFLQFLSMGVWRRRVDYTLKCRNIVALRLSELARYMSHLSQQMGRKGTQLPWHPCGSVIDGLSWWWTSTAMVWQEVPLKNQYSVLSLSTACQNYSLLFSALDSLTVNWRWTLHHRIIEKCRWDECGFQSPRAQDLTK